MDEVVQLTARAPELRVPAALGALNDIAGYVLALARRAGLPGPLAYRLRLAVDELATNVVTHGYGGGGCPGSGGSSGGPAAAPGDIVVRGGFDADRVWVRIEDTAPAFDPRDGRLAPTPGVPLERRRIGGLGVHLALTSVDEFTYAYLDGRNISTLAVRTGPGRPTGGASARP
ncbi:ATP-binding protein [Streptomyces sp. NPDC002004]